LSTHPGLGDSPETAEGSKPQGHVKVKKSAGRRPVPTDLDDGRDLIYKLFVDAKVITAAHFEECWVKTDYSVTPEAAVEPFIQLLADKGFSPLDRSMRILSDKGRAGFLPLDKYDIDVELARSFPADTCRRWCMLPFDRLSKSVLVATANPFNRQALAELEEVSKQRLLCYLAPPSDIIKALKKVYR
jgi:hypothetical protein